MQINNPFQLNDWNIWKFLGAVFAFQALVLLVTGLNQYGIQLPVIQPILLFVYMIFIPGILVLRALNIHRLGSVTTVLYAVGLSIGTLMFTGLLLNTFLPLAGYTRPIALFPITVALTTFVLAMSAICYIRDRNYEGDATLELNTFVASRTLLLLLVPFLAIFGTFLMKNYEDNVLLLLMVLAIAIIVLLIGFNKLIPKELYPLAIFVIAISLLFHNSLISDNLIGWDIHQEMSRASEVISNGHWNFSTYSVINSMLSIMMLAPFFSIFLSMDMVWVYKIIFPLLFALMPVALYQAYKKQSNEILAFMASFFFVSLVVFFSEMLQLARQEIAELFVALIILLIVDRSMQKSRWSLLFLVFAASLVLSHYGLTFIFIGTIALGWALVYIVSKLKRDTIRDMNRRVRPMLIVALIAFCAIWYIYTSSSNPFVTVVGVTHRIEKPLEAIATDLLASGTPVVTPTPGTTPGVTPVPGTTTPEPTPPQVISQPIELITTGGEASFLHKMFLYLLVSTQGILVIGILTALFAKWPMRIRIEYYALALVNLMMLGVALVLPNFASALNTTRVYQIALIILAPFFVLGWVNIFKAIGKITKRSMTGTMTVAVELLSIFLILYLIFNTGVIFEVAKDVPMSYSLDKKGANVSYTVYNSFEKAGAEWTIDVQQAIARSQNMNYTPPVFSDIYRWLFLQEWNISRSYQMSPVAEETPLGTYVYFGTFNVLNDRAIGVTYTDQSKHFKLVNLSGLKNARNKIYANGGSEVYY